MTKQLIVNAARAAGIKGKWGHESYIERHEGFIPTGWRRAWNPLTNNKDAFELMVATNALVLPGLVETLMEEMGAPDFQDRESATRRAIVRAAVMQISQLDSATTSQSTNPAIPAGKE